MLLTLSAALALVYGVRYCDAPPSAMRSIVKTVPVACLALAAALSGNPLLCIALALSALGDLALSRAGERAFLAGLAAFAAAHAIYVAILLPAAAMPPAPALAVLLLLAASTVVWLLPHAGALRMPVALYVALITAMGLAAWGQADPLVRVGATVFILSDLLLALQVFRHVPGLSRPLWALYWSGQALIAGGLGAVL